MRSGIVRAKSLATSMICGRLRRLVVISKVATPGYRSGKVTMLETSEPRHW
jgi:hypothetical protein